MIKKFFKKIGKGLKKLGKGIMKVLNSKIGRIIGMVSLAFGVGSIFKAMYQGLTQGTATAASTAAGTAQTAGAEVAKEVGGDLAKQTVQEGAKETVKSAVSDTALKETVGQVEKLVANTANVSGTTVTEVASKGVQEAAADPTIFQSAVETTAKDAVKQQVITPKDILQQTQSESTSLLGETFSDPTGIAQNYGVETKSLLGDPNVMEAALQGDAAKAVTPQVLDPAMEAQIAEFKQLAPKKLADMLKNPEQRTLYDSLVGPSQGLESVTGTSLQLTPSSQLPGVQEFTSFKEAYQSGDNLLTSLGNVAERGLTYDLGELTGGKLKGFIGSQGAYQTGSAAAALFSEPEPLDFPRPNPYAAAEVATLSEIGATTAYQPIDMQMDFTNQMATGRVTNPFSTLNSIRQLAGYGNVYGNLNSMVGLGA